MLNESEKPKLACEAYHFRAGLGMEIITGKGFRAIRDNDRRQVWDLNRIFDVTADTHDEIALLMHAASSTFELQGYNYFSITPFTPSKFVAHLATEDFQEQIPVVQMVLEDDIKVPTPKGFKLFSVSSDEKWDILYELVRLDHIEGVRTGGQNLDEAFTQSVVEGYRRKSKSCQFFLAYLEDTVCGYGSGTVVPNQMGMVEDLFTLPKFRRRGIASAVIAGCVQHVRDNGCDSVLIGSLVTEPPKHLYRKLGFRPVCLTRSFHKPLPTVA